jgi:hypothetical protein
MAKQTGLIKLKGKVGDLSFYKTRDGHLAREKGGVDAERIARDPAFVRTRENGAEFGSSATAGKLMRDALRPLIMRAADARVTSRLTKVMTLIKNLDATSARGDRNVGVAIVLPAAKELLKGFNFNNRSILGSVLFKPLVIDAATGSITLTGLVPANEIAAPSGATHFSVRTGWAKLDFVQGLKALEVSAPFNGPIDGNAVDVLLTPAQAPAGAGTNVHLLMIEFFQEVNGIQYVLNNGQYNALAIVEVN